MDVALKILLALALVGLNGFFVAAEFAAVSARASRLETTDPIGLFARFGLKVKRQLDLYLSSCQLGITIASLGLGYVLEPAIVTLIEPPLEVFGWPVPQTHFIAVAIALAIGTTLHVVVGEVAPKNWAIYHPDKLLRALALPLVLFTYLFYPVIWALNALSNVLLRLLGISVDHTNHGLPHTAEELRVLLEQSVKQGAIPVDDSILPSAFDFGDLKARQIMRPRTEVDYLKLGQPIMQVLELARKTTHTRLPLCDGDMDHVVGLVHIKDLFNQLQLVPGRLRFTDQRTPDGMAIAIADGAPGSAIHVIGSANIELDQIKRDVLFVPESLPVPRLLRQFQSSRTHMAIVVDEYGATQGVVTLEDVIEEIVGEIEDEFDVADGIEFVREGDQIRVSGLYPLHELREQIDLDEVELNDVDTLGGYITQQLGRLARVGDSVELAGYSARVIAVQKRRITQVLLTPVQPDVATDI